MRPTDRFENWFITSLQTGINDTTGSFRLNDNLNVSQARLVIDPYDESIREVVKVTSVDGNLVYVERGDDNTPASYHQEGAIVVLNVVAGDMNDLYADFAGVVDATDAANQAASDANSAASAASSAASAATTATGLANTATSNANAATSAANSAAGSANSAASSANTAAGNAQTAANNAQGIVDDVAAAARSALSPELQFSGGRVGVGKVPAAGRKLDVDGDIYSNGAKVSTQTPLHTCILRASSAQNIASGGATPLVFSETDLFDPYNWHNPSSQNTRITVSVTGLYRLLGSVQWQDRTGSYRIVGFRINGTNLRLTTRSAPDSDGRSGNSIIDYTLLNAGDYVELTVNHGTGSAIGIPLALVEVSLVA